MEAMLVNVALTGKRAGMEPKAISSKADSYYYHYYSFFFLEKLRSNIIDRSSLSYPALFS